MSEEEYTEEYEEPAYWSEPSTEANVRRYLEEEEGLSPDEAKSAIGKGAEIIQRGLNFKSHTFYVGEEVAKNWRGE